MKRSRSAVYGLLLTLACLSAQGQGDPATGRVVGVVKDRTGAVVPAGTVEIRAVASPLARATACDRLGRYAFDALPPGRYTVSVLAPGLERSVREAVLVVANAESLADFTLNVAPRVAFVEVTAAQSLRPLVIETDPRTPRQPIPAHDGATSRLRAGRPRLRLAHVRQLWPQRLGRRGPGRRAQGVCAGVWHSLGPGGL